MLEFEIAMVIRLPQRKLAEIQELVSGEEGMSRAGATSSGLTCAEVQEWWHLAGRSCGGCLSSCMQDLPKPIISLRPRSQDLVTYLPGARQLHASTMFLKT